MHTYCTIIERRYRIMMERRERKRWDNDIWFQFQVKPFSFYVLWHMQLCRARNRKKMTFSPKRYTYIKKLSNDIAFGFQCWCRSYPILRIFQIFFIKQGKEPLERISLQQPAHTKWNNEPNSKHWELSYFSISREWQSKIIDKQASLNAL